MRTIDVAVNQRRIHVDGNPKIAAGSRFEDQIRFSFDDEWRMMDHLFVVFSGVVAKTVDMAELVTVPWECVTKPCFLRVAVIGVDSNGTAKLVTKRQVPGIEVVRSDKHPEEGQQQTIGTVENASIAALGALSLMEAIEAACDGQAKTLDELQKQVSDASESENLRKQAEKKRSEDFDQKLGEWERQIDDMTFSFKVNESGYLCVAVNTSR